MTAPVWKPWCGLEALYLGRVIVGRVSISRNQKGDQASWIFNLAGCSAFWKTARTLEQAKAEVERSLAEWLEQAGLA